MALPAPPAPFLETEASTSRGAEASEPPEEGRAAGGESVPSDDSSASEGGESSYEDSGSDTSDDSDEYDESVSEKRGVEGGQGPAAKKLRSGTT